MVVDRHSVLQWAHLGVADVEPYRSILAENRRVAQEHITEIEAERERLNAALHRIDNSHIPPLRIAERYTGGRPRRVAPVTPAGFSRPCVAEAFERVLEQHAEALKRLADQ